jgi:hypothetical protein
MQTHVTTGFGGYVLRFVCEDAGVADLLALHFRENLTVEEPDVTLTMKLVEPGVIATADDQSESRYAFFDQGTVNFGPNLLEGRWDFGSKMFALLVSRELMVQDDLWLFDRFLCRLYYTLVMRERRRSSRPFIVHCAGVARDGRGYIFFGPPGSGKSTAASLSRRFHIMHDDMNIVTLYGDRVHVQGVPFNPKLIERTNVGVPLSMICSLHQSDVVRLERGTPDEFLQKVVPENFLPLPLFSNARKHAFQYLLQCLRELSRQVPYYRLYFKKDESFWDHIATVEVPHGQHSAAVHQKN